MGEFKNKNLDIEMEQHTPSPGKRARTPKKASISKKVKNMSLVEKLKLLDQGIVLYSGSKPLGGSRKSEEIM